MVVFNCVHCKGRIDATGLTRGQLIVCPHCNKEINAPSPGTNPPLSPHAKDDAMHRRHDLQWKKQLNDKLTSIMWVCIASALFSAASLVIVGIWECRFQKIQSNIRDFRDSITQRD